MTTTNPKKKKKKNRARRRKGKSVEAARTISKKAKAPAEGEPWSLSKAMAELTDDDLFAIGAVEDGPGHPIPRK